MTDTTTGPHFFLLDDIEWPDETLAPTAPRGARREGPAARVRAASTSHAARAASSRSTRSSRPASPCRCTRHDHNEVIVCMRGSLTMLGDAVRRCGPATRWS